MCHLKCVLPYCSDTGKLILMTVFTCSMATGEEKTLTLSKSFSIYLHSYNFPETCPSINCFSWYSTKLISDLPAKAHDCLLVVHFLFQVSLGDCLRDIYLCLPRHFQPEAKLL